ncbi:unnamed protein product [Mycena citricolor]|uniref:Autophagy-related protein 29 n=1 Tax=Mycena citricolor TaxID=2018698 RepID=A0AAD2Q2T6_9AGAR|nr:unnamed protein product [Mycena citricolor]
MSANPPPNIRVVVRIPHNRPEQAIPDPPRIEWTQEKADILWKVIERSRSTDNAGTDWKGLAAHLDVPLPYLLYRVQGRFQEELRGLQDIPGVSSPSVAQPNNKPFEDAAISPIDKPSSVAMRAVHRLSTSGRMSPAGRLSTPLGVRARLNSLGKNSVPQPKKALSSSTLTAQVTFGGGPAKRTLSPPSSNPESGTDSEDEESKREEEAERNAEEQESLERKLQELQLMVTNESLGLVSRPPRPPLHSSSSSSKGKTRAIEVDRGRANQINTLPAQMTFRREKAYSPMSVSSASSAQSSIPDIPSPSNGSRTHSPMSRHLSPSKSSSPPALSPRSALGRAYATEQGSNQGSEASSFSDMSDLSTSALDSAFLSNFRGPASRVSSVFSGRSRMSTRPFPL